MAKQPCFFWGLSISLIVFFTLLISPAYGQTITISPSEEDTLYELPHPGILPDNPFYVVKNIRDTLIRWSAQDLHEKAEIQLLQSDKYMGMALELAKKGKHKLTVETLIEGEKKFLEVPVMLEEMMKNGEKPRKQFLQEAIESNTRHREAIEEVMFNLPQGDDAGSFRKALQLNDEAQKMLKSIADDM
jgi:hypothetical protein